MRLRIGTLPESIQLYEAAKVCDVADLARVDPAAVRLMNQKVSLPTRFHANKSLNVVLGYVQ
jgi:hypothetical protein